MKVHWQEVGMVAGIAWILSIVTQIQQLGFWLALLMGLPVGLLAGAAYWLLMPLVIRWAARGARPKDAKTGEDSSGPESSDEESARR